MKYLILDNEVIGRIEGNQNPPGNATVITGPWAPENDQLYVDGDKVKVRPEKPSPAAWWDKGEKAWKEPIPLPEIATPDWQGLAAALPGGPIWAKFYAAGTKDLRANLAGTLLLTTITSSHNLDDLTFAIAELLDAMEQASGVTTLTATQKTTLDNLLETHGMK